jgi:hypothetical protein
MARLGFLEAYRVKNKMIYKLMRQALIRSQARTFGRLRCGRTKPFKRTALARNCSKRFGISLQFKYICSSMLKDEAFIYIMFRRDRFYKEMTHVSNDNISKPTIPDGRSAAESSAATLGLGARTMFWPIIGVGPAVGPVEGATEGSAEGDTDGTTEGVGPAVGRVEGATEGSAEGDADGITEGIIEDIAEGVCKTFGFITRAAPPAMIAFPA